MKNFTKLLVLALVAIVMAALLSVCVSAEAEAPAIPDPRELKPGSDRVVFIKDAPRDEDNKLTGEPLAGDGTGTDAENPLKPTEDHERFDPSAERKRWHVLTAFYQAVEMLADTGGTIVICGPIYVDIDQVGDNGASTVRDLETVRFGDKVIKFTSVYDGVDYRETAGAKITLQTPAMLNILGSTIWENIDFYTDGTDRAVCFGDYATLVGEGINCYPTDDAFDGVAQNYISLSGGHRYNSSKNKTPNLVVQSGTYNKITGASWGTVATNAQENCNVNLTIEGTTTVLGVVSGTVNTKSPFGGHVNITINNGTFECDINAVGATGMTNTDGIAKIKINGGNFINAWSINQSAMGAINNMPADCSVDFSEWKGDDLNLAFAFGVITDITNIKLPEGKTAEYLQEIVKNYVPEETEPEETEPEATEPEATDPAESQPAEATDPVEETEPEASTPSEGENEGEGEDKADEKEEGGNGWILWVAIAAGVVVVAAIIVVVLKKKKN